MVRGWLACRPLEAMNLLNHLKAKKEYTRHTLMFIYFSREVEIIDKEVNVKSELFDSAYLEINSDETVYWPTIAYNRK